MSRAAGTVHVIGAANQDLLAAVERHPAPGETVLGTSLAAFPGGKGANQAVAAARAGAPTVLVGAVGDDDAGRALVANLAASGVDITHVAAQPDAPTGTALIAVADAENTIIVIPGANGRIDPAAVDAVDLTPVDLVVAQLEVPAQVSVRAFERARAAGASTLLNPAPADQVPADLLALTDVLVVNEHEFEHVFGSPVDTDRPRVPDAAGRVGEGFEGTVVVTLGARGAIAHLDDGPIRVPGLPVDAVDTTGAGDCFVGYLAAGLVAGHDLGRCMADANAAAALSATRRGAASSIPWRVELADALGPPGTQPPEPEPGSTR